MWLIQIGEMLQGRFGDGGRGVAPARGERKDVGDLEGREVDGDGPTTTPLLRRGDRKQKTQRNYYFLYKHLYMT